MIDEPGVRDGFPHHPSGPSRRRAVRHVRQRLQVRGWRGSGLPRRRRRWSDGRRQLGRHGRPGRGQGSATSCQRRAAIQLPPLSSWVFLERKGRGVPGNDTASSARSGPRAAPCWWQTATALSGRATAPGSGGSMAATPLRAPHPRSQAAGAYRATALLHDSPPRLQSRHARG